MTSRYSPGRRVSAGRLGDSVTESLWSAVQAGARNDPDAPLLIEADGRTYSWGLIQRLALEWADSLLVVGSSARVAAILPNQAAAHMLRLACGYAGVTFAPISPLLRGKILADALSRSSITDIVVTADTVATVDDAARLLPHSVRVHFLADDEIHVHPHHRSVTTNQLTPDPDPEETQAIVYTSGTSGPAKPVILTARSLYQYGQNLFDDVGRCYPPGGSYYSPWHPAHILGLVALDVAVHRGLALVIREKFEEAAFWEDVSRYDSRLAVLISVGAEVWAQRDESDRDNPLELVGMSPVIPQLKEFEEHFRVETLSIYGMTEVGPVLLQRSPAGGAIVGHPVPGYECRLEPVAELDARGGNVGELVVRPSIHTSDYGAQVDADTGSWVDGWFHTGDLFIEVEDGYRFVGRIKDCIRRRGRNISVADLEAQVMEVPGVLRAACIGYVESSAPGGDDQIRLFVQFGTGSEITPAQLIRELRGLLPNYMLPRYIDILDEFPRTSTGKLQRGSLRKLPLSPTTYDRLATLKSVDVS
jgi:crotonobetaine/carnitine-CoA ligase